MHTPRSRREFLRDMGLGAATLPFILNLPSLGFANQGAKAKQRLVFVFTPNGVFPNEFWPSEEGAKFALKESMKPFEPFQDKLLVLNGICDKIRGDGDSHMRGIGCLLTGIELYPGNIQGGSHTPAGWASGISIDQEIKNYLQKNEATRTRFGSLELGVMVPEQAIDQTAVRPYVVRLKGGKVEKVDVQLGVRDEAAGAFEVKSGESIVLTAKRTGYRDLSLTLNEGSADKQVMKMIPVPPPSWKPAWQCSRISTPSGA